jgi:hypothetical protein
MRGVWGRKSPLGPLGPSRDFLSPAAGFRLQLAFAPAAQRIFEQLATAAPRRRIECERRARMCVHVCCVYMYIYQRRVQLQQQQQQLQLQQQQQQQHTHTQFFCININPSTREIIHSAVNRTIGRIKLLGQVRSTAESKYRLNPNIRLNRTFGGESPPLKQT